MAQLDILGQASGRALPPARGQDPAKRPRLQHDNRSSAHLGTAVPNLLIMESNYWKYTHQYPHFVNNVPVPEGGHVRPPERPGIGAEIRPELFKTGDAIVETVARAS